MKSYFPYILLLVLILISAVETWGETNKTILYGIAVAGLIGLTVMKAIEKRRKNYY
ncbi:hypothetical protein [Planococcus sp. CPCC 101016]|uniref:hypothetical protein n=1 Tax=Planococcus sp. CPCC 101016 TaxID=2599617 RepID=UPI0016448011|nr:hypothetical protein [Planococcus sp. CPCC 101016]